MVIGGKENNGTTADKLRVPEEKNIDTHQECQYICFWWQVV